MITNLEHMMAALLTIIVLACIFCIGVLLFSFISVCIVYVVTYIKVRNHRLHTRYGIIRGKDADRLIEDINKPRDPEAIRQGAEILRDQFKSK